MCIYVDHQRLMCEDRVLGWYDLHGQTHTQRERDTYTPWSRADGQFTVGNDGVIREGCLQSIERLACSHSCRSAAMCAPGFGLPLLPQCVCVICARSLSLSLSLSLSVRALLCSALQWTRARVHTRSLRGRTPTWRRLSMILLMRPIDMPEELFPDP